jgi:hypothetical protein
MNVLAFFTVVNLHTPRKCLTGTIVGVAGLVGVDIEVDNDFRHWSWYGCRLLLLLLLV